MQRWLGKVAIVTGASSGIGKSIAEKLVKEGIIVAGFARRKERIEELAESLSGSTTVKGKLHAVKVDVSKENDILEGFKWVKNNLGPVNILINNAGINRNNGLINGNSMQWKEVLDTNIFGLLVATREAINDMRDNKVDGHIIHINSTTGHKVPFASGMNVYPASKFAVRALAETLKFDLIRKNLNIKVTNLSPGNVRTEILEAAGFDPAKSFLTHSPQIQPEDIANGVLYALGTPPNVQVSQLTIQPLGERM